MNPDYNFQVFQEQFTYTIAKLSKSKTHFIIGGDLNIDFMKTTSIIEQYT